MGIHDGVKSKYVFINCVDARFSNTFYEKQQLLPTENMKIPELVILLSGILTWSIALAESGEFVFSLISILQSCIITISYITSIFLHQKIV